MSVDVLQIIEGLSHRLSFRLRRSSSTSRQWLTCRGSWLTPRGMGFLQILQHPTSQGAERLQRSPIELLLLPQAWIFTDQPIVLAIEAAAIRALAGLFGHRNFPINQP